jgi:WD40 repeat protein
MVDAEAVAYVDKLIEEYLLFRGFTQSLKTFQNEKKNDKTKGYKVQKIVSTLLSNIQSLNITAVLEMWNHLQQTFFQRLDEDMTLTVQQLEISVKRYYLIHAIQQGKTEKVTEFFTVLGDSLAQDKNWKSWFALPYMKNPENDIHFRVFFSKTWYEAFTLSLHNFLSVIFQNVPLPKILNFNMERTARLTLEAQINHLTTENENLRKKLDDAKRDIDSLHKADRVKRANEILVEETSKSRSNSVVEQIPPGYTSFNEIQRKRLHSSATEMDKPIRPETSPKFESSPRVATQPVSINQPPGAKEPTLPNSPRNQTLSIGLAHRQTSEQLPGEPLPSTFNLVISNTEAFSINAPINCCKFSSDGSYFACGSKAGVTKIFPLGTAHNKNAATIIGSSEIQALEWDHKTSKLLFLGTSDGHVKIWSVSADKFVGDITVGSGYKKVKDIVCSPSDNSFVCSLGNAVENQPGAVVTYNLKTLQQSTKIDVMPQTTINALALNHNGTMMVAAGADGMIRLYDMTSFKSIMGWKAHAGEVAGVRFSVDETSIYSVGADSKITQWSLHNIGKMMKQYEYEGYYTENGFAPRKVDMSFDENGKYFLIGSKNNTALMYNVDHSLPILSVGKHTKPVICIDWHPTESCCLTGSLDWSVCMTSFAQVPNSPLHD